MSTNQEKKKPNWDAFYGESKRYQPSTILVRALDHCSEVGHALDLGAGALQDSQFLLSQGWEVTAVDSATSVQKIAEEIGNNRLHVYITPFDQYKFPSARFLLVNAMYTLSFNPPQSFMRVMESIKASIAVGGIFCGNIFGPEDDWSQNPEMTFLQRSEVEEIFSDMEILFFEEVQRDNILANGTPKHWHEFRVIARKRK